MASRLILAIGLVLAVSGPAAAAAPAWVPPVTSENKTFPVLRSSEGKWLNWRDTYGAPRMRLVGGVWKQVGVHQGIDIYTERGAPIVSIGPGIVANIGWTFYSGLRVGIKGDDGRYYFYAHLSEIASGLAQGARVSSGSRLGAVGSSGYGPEGTMDEFPAHLHFGLQTGTRWDNPQRLLKNLYEASLSATERIVADRKLIDARLRQLQGRRALQGDPSTGQIEQLASALQKQKAQLERSMVAE